MKSIQQIKIEDVREYLKSIDKLTWVRSAVFIVILSILGVYVAWPAWIVRVEIKKKMKATQSQIKTTQALLSKQSELLSSREKYTKQIQDAKNRLYSPGETALLLGTISKIAEESGVGIISSSPKKFEEKFLPPFDAAYEGALFDITVEGSYHDLGKFVSRIESNPKLLRIQHFYLLPQENNPKKHLADVSLSAVTLKKNEAAQ